MSYTVAVRALCEFTAKRGDLDLRFTPSPTALEGIEGHGVVAARRGPAYESEISLAGDYLDLHVRGRADGYDAARNRLEEIKTYRGDLSATPDNHRHLHWAQARIYGWLMCQKLHLDDIELALVYFDIGTQKETLLTEAWTAPDLLVFFNEHCARFLAWSEQEVTHRNARDNAIEALSFPYENFRAGQRELATAVYKSARQSKALIAQAPTGIGKTIGTVFPMLKAFPLQKIDKLFFLTAKNSGRKLALDAIDRIASSAATTAKPLRLRTLEMIARDKACEHRDLACHGASCPLAAGFYDRLPAAREAAVQLGMLDKETLRAVARAHEVCPYYLSQELARWSDVVVGDYNYYFDASALLYALTATNEWRVTVLVDEAHNMIERGRKMYSGELGSARLGALRASAPKELRKALNYIHRCWPDYATDTDEGYRAHEEIPAALVGALQQAVGAITDFMSDHPAAVDAALQDFYFEALGFMGLAETFGKHSLFDITHFPAVRGRGSSSVLCIRNVVPAPFLTPRFEASHATVLFSATLQPWQFYADTLGMPDDTHWIDIASPFAAQQLSVRIVGDISTRYRDRDASLAPIVDVIEAQYARQPGNYLAFASSFDYLERVADLFRQRCPHVPVWLQSRGMSESARSEFLERFQDRGQGIGFAVLGGAFGEAIDLPGDRLIGAFIATLGLPQVNPVNEQIMQRMHAVFGNGYDTTYLYPGLQKVVQAAGRVIRTEQDRGSIYLIDDRFAQQKVRRLLPAWWHVQ